MKKISAIINRGARNSGEYVYAQKVQQNLAF
jgi:hypothetical protein